jgi:Family of unknown function (DUF6314)
LHFWKKLSSIKDLTFHAKTRSKSQSGWNGKGTAKVLIENPHKNSLIYVEKGNWKNNEGNEMGFSNVFRWTIDTSACLLSLEHLRRGFQHPVFLFHLLPSNAKKLISLDAHTCEEDMYFGQLFNDKNHLRLNVRVIGPKKNEEIDYFYF